VPKAGTKALIGAVVAVGLCIGIAVQVLDQAEPLGVQGDWDVRFEEDFSGDRLDPEQWADHEEWEADGYAISDAWAPVPAGRQQLELRDGRAVLKARRGDDLPDDRTFTSSSIHTRGRFSLPEGATSYVEARLKAPAGKGLLPAFWLLGNGDNETGEGWPINGEVDILEFANNKDEAERPYFSVWYPADVYTNPPGTFLNGAHDTHPDSFEPEPDLVGSWHTWGLYRSPEKMEVYIDGVRRFTFEPGRSYKTGTPLPPMLFTNPMHIRLSLAVGGDWAGAGLDPQEYEEDDLSVDYVRAWVQDS
jgi:beta-glucanase (GH16 family)